MELQMLPSIKSAGVLGAGSWGSALAIALSHVVPVTLWSHNGQQVQQIKATRANHGYLPDSVVFPEKITITDDFAKTMASDLVVVATPLSALRQILLQIKQVCPPDGYPAILWACKGFEVDSGLLPHEIVMDVMGPVENVGALLGPTFAEEVALGKPTAISLTSGSLSFATHWVQQLQGIPNFRIYANTDVIGSEIGAGVKNIMAIAVGILDGLGLGLNARAALITRGLSEISKLVAVLGGKTETVYGLTGVGDLILTCTGDLSRNRQVGLELARGQKITTILSNIGHVAEGVVATKEVYKHCQRLQVEMPIVEAVYRVLYEDANLADSVLGLLSRAPKFE